MEARSPFAQLFPVGFARFIRRDPRLHSSGLEPDDVLSDLAVAILTSRLTVPVRGIRLRWLYLDVLRRARRHTRRHAPLDGTFPVQPRPDVQVDLTRLAARMTCEQRDALTAVAWLGHTLEEASRALGVCRSTVHRRLASVRHQPTT
jgi:hypothetical protein